jgi:putative ABC transport system permease protein
MFMMESIKVALQNLNRRKMRSFLTMLGMIFGVSAVIAMLSIGAGAESESLRMIESFGIRNIIIEAKDFKPEEFKQIRTESLGLHMRDVEAIEAVIRPKPLVSAKRIVKTWQVCSKQNRSDSRVLGVSSTYAEINNLKLLQGSFFMPFDDEPKTRFACSAFQPNRSSSVLAMLSGKRSKSTTSGSRSSEFLPMRPSGRRRSLRV